MPDLTATCYGQHYGKLDHCEMCEEAPWCKDAADPKPITGGTAGTVTGQDAAYEAAQQEPHPPQEHDAGATTEFSEAAKAILDACEFNPARVAAVMFRLAELSYDAIGKSLATVRPGKTRQAVLKDIDAVAARNPALGRLIRQRFSRVVDPRTVNGRLLAAYVVRRPLWHGPMTGPAGLYGMLATEFALASWIAARNRVRRCTVAVDRRGIGNDTTEGEIL